MASPTRSNGGTEVPPVLPSIPLSAEVANNGGASVGGLVSEAEGRIPLPGEVVQVGALRLEVVASTDRRVERVRVSAIESDDR